MQRKKAINLVPKNIRKTPVQQIRQVALSVVFLVVAGVGVTFADWQMEGGRAPSPKKEKDLIAVLHSDAPKVKKADACKDLAVYGSKAAVPELAKLLTEEQLASWAGVPLVGVPGPETKKAPRDPLPKLNGLLLIGAIDSLGVRRDAAAVAPLTSHLQDKDVAVASATAAALGHIGNADAAKSLEQSLASAPPKVRSAVAEGL